jgi:XTP/dITP diphosphohydrolase
VDRLVLVANSHRVAPGLLSFPAWVELKKGPVFTATADHPQLPHLDMAGVEVTVLDAADGPQGLRVGYLAGGGDPLAASLAFQFRELARGGQAVWLAGPGGDPDFARALGDIAGREGGVEMEVVYGSYDMPGAKLLDLVATMDRLRSPGGCPWDAEQTHDSLARYLVEETYEALDAIERGDVAGLRDELGDVLLQVVFHARVAEERDDDTRWTIDDVAGRIVEKLVRRHPHVFAGVEVADADEVVANWDEIKRAERVDAGADVDPLAHVPLGQPALTLAATLLRKAGKAGLEFEPPRLDEAVVTAQGLHAADSAGEPPLADLAEAAVADLLLAAVSLAADLDVDPESALRSRAKAFRDALTTPAEPESWSVPDEGEIDG